MLKKTTNCIYCGQKVEGDFVRDNTQKVARGASRVLGTLSAILRGDPVSAYNNATGNTQDSVEKYSAKFAGGAKYHFNCPYCGQGFDKVVY